MKPMAMVMLVLAAAGVVQATCGADAVEAGLLKEPRGIGVDSQDRVVVAYAASHVVAVYGPDRQLVRLLGRLEKPGADTGHFDEPYGITLDVADSIYVADTNNDRICVFDCKGKFLRAIGDADGPGRLSRPRGCEVDENDNVLIADTENNRIVAFSKDGKYRPDLSIEGAAAAELRQPNNVVLQEYGRGKMRRLMIANTGHGRLERYDWKEVKEEGDGERKKVKKWVWTEKYWANPGATDIAAGTSGDIYTACPDWKAVRRWTVDMAYEWDTISSEYSKALWGLAGLGVAKLGVEPYGIALTSKGHLLVTWPEANRVIRFTGEMRDPPRPEVARRRRTSAVITYETLVPTPSLVEYSSDGEHWTSAGSLKPRTRHAVKLAGLEPGTQYRFRVSYGCSFAPKAPFFGREWRFATAAPRGMVRYLDMPVLVVLYANIYERAKVPEGVRPPQAMTDEGVEALKRQMEQGAYLYFFASRWLMNIHFDWVIVNEPQLVFPDPEALEQLGREDRAKFDELMGRASQRGLVERTDENRAEIIALLKEMLGDAVGERELEWLTAPNRWKRGPNWVWETEEEFEALAQAQHGKWHKDYAGVISLGCLWHWHKGDAPGDLVPGRVQPAAYEDPDAPSARGYWRQAGSGGLTPFWWCGVGRCAFNTGGDTVGLFVHEFGHKVDGQFLFSGYQEFEFNHFAMAYLEGRFTGGLSGNGYVLRIFPEEWYFASILGEVKLAMDTDGDGLADEDAALICDEKRFGSSPRSRDTDGDGLSDYKEMLLTYGVQAIELGNKRMIERQFPPRPDLADADGDGLRDNKDPYPLYPVPEAIAKRTPVLDGQIGPDEWGVYRVFRDVELVGTLYMSWDDDALYLALATDRWSRMKVMLDCRQDGSCWSNDNMTIHVMPETGDPIGEVETCRVELRLRDCSVRGPDAKVNESNKRLYDVGKIRYATGTQGDLKVLEIAVPRNLRVGLDPRNGYAFDFACVLQPIGSRTELALFELDWFVGVTLVEKK